MKSQSMNLLAKLVWATVATAATFGSQHRLQKNPAGSTSGVLEMPLLGFGTWNLRSDGHNASDAVEHAIKSGYRHIDCAAIYGNEVDVGRGIGRGLEAAGIPREHLWVTSKLWNTHHDPKEVPKALQKTLEDLKLDYLDLYLMHWPVADDGEKKTIEFVETWKAMELLLNTGLVRQIGVSNFSPAQLRELMKHTSVKPFAHQMELHPYLPQTAWLLYHREQGIRVTAYSPLGDSNPTYHGTGNMFSKSPWSKVHVAGPSELALPPLLENPAVRSIAEERGCTPATVVLSWGVARGTSVIPKSQHKDRIEENMGSCDLEYEDILSIHRIGLATPTRFNNPSKEWGVPLYDGLQG